MSAESANAVQRSQVDLMDFIDWSGVECLNHITSNSVVNALKQGYREDEGLNLESDADEQLLIYIPFLHVIKLHSIIIKGTEEDGPKTVKLFSNKEHMGFSNVNEAIDDESPNINEGVDMSDYEKYNKLLAQAQIPVYDGCQVSVLSAIMSQMQLKVKHRTSIGHYEDCSEFIKTLLPKENRLPYSHYKTKKILGDLGLNYVKIHACKNNCVLFYGDYKDANYCPICNGPRYEDETSSRGKLVPVNVALEPYQESLTSDIPDTGTTRINNNLHFPQGEYIPISGIELDFGLLPYIPPINDFINDEDESSYSDEIPEDDLEDPDYEDNN